MDANYKNINLNLFDPNVLGNFKVQKLADNSVRLLRYKDERDGAVSFKPSHTGFNGTRYFNLSVAKENREVDCVITIIRTSENCYIVIGSGDKSEYKRLSNVVEISNYIKANFCRTLLSEVSK